MFRTVFLSVIRSSKLHIQLQLFVKPILLPAASLAGSSIKGKIESHLAKTLSRWPIETKFFNKIIMEDETCCFACDPETKRQSSEWRHPLGRRN